MQKLKIHLHPILSPTSLSHAFLRDDEISQHLVLRRASTSTIAQSIIINENSKSTPIGSEATREVDIKEEEEEKYCQEIINVVGLRDRDDDYDLYESKEEAIFRTEKSFWKCKISLTYRWESKDS
ncbi:1921_t:CDS:2 [Funneliformis caledonium]|uniref:1921_t:CDS:1 n=1 Tax=Funneliformis caledonium TaxID=1117310 RepID=A0A9N9E9E8_9GLOM|nr:1921_t:CDS:2 [Funneliformis caledonium]